MRFKSILVGLVVQVLLFNAVHAQYTVQIAKEYWSWQINGNELEGNLVATLLLNGQVVDTAGYSCTWYRNWNNPTVWELYRSGFQAGTASPQGPVMMSRRWSLNQGIPHSLLKLSSTLMLPQLPRGAFSSSIPSWKTSSPQSAITYFSGHGLIGMPASLPPSPQNQ